MKRISPSNARLVFIALFLLLVGTPAGVSAGGITLAWDPSPSPGVIGYRVYVGTEPGVYTQTYDVGLVTSFLYQTSETRQFYLAVAAYAAGQTVGPLSAAVSGYPRETSFWDDARSFYQSLWREPTAGRSSMTREVMPSFAPATCWTPSECLLVQTLARRSSPITSLVAATDGRIFFIDAGAQLNVIAANAIDAVMTVESPAVVLTQVNLDPRFDQTGLIYIGETESGAAGEREFRIARYRVAGTRAEERSVVARIPLPSSGEPRFTVAASGNVFVAVPRIPTEDTPLAGTVLRLDPTANDGGTPAIMTTGYNTPTAMAFDETTGLVWLAGIDALNQPSLSSLTLDLSHSASSSLAAPIQSLAVAADATGNWLFGSSTAGAFARASVHPNSTIGDTSQVTFTSGLVQAVSTTPGGALLVAVWNEQSGSSSAYSILRLTSRTLGQGQP